MRYFKSELPENSLALAQESCDYFQTIAAFDEHNPCKCSEQRELPDTIRHDKA